MPLVRGRIIPEIQLAGRAKQFLDVLLWAEDLGPTDLGALDELDVLRTYLRSLDPFVCYVRVWVAEQHARSIARLDELGIAHRTARCHEPDKNLAAKLEGADAELLKATATALSMDADCLAVATKGWLPFAPQINDGLGLLLTDCTFLLPYAELFSRGHDVPWAFGVKEWNAPWDTFYQMTEQCTFRSGIVLLRGAGEKNAASGARETGRSLVFNRLANLCFTRDRLLFYEMQRLAAKRAGWKRQRFAFEVAYYLNFYYLLMHGAFDHAAQLINELLKLGLADRQVGARSPAFVDSIRKSAPSLHAIFTSDETKTFIDRIASLRHYAAHRGSVTPTIVVQAPDKEPTVGELDDDIRKAGWDVTASAFPPGPERERYWEMLRENATMARYEKEKLLDDVVPVKIGDKFGFINPLIDTSWNFKRVTAFLDAVFAECAQLI